MACARISAYGPILPTWALQQVGSYLGYSGRNANIVTEQPLTQLRHSQASHVE
jgi:hypothetical protein